MPRRKRRPRDPALEAKLGCQLERLRVAKELAPFRVAERRLARRRKGA